VSLQQAKTEDTTEEVTLLPQNNSIKTFSRQMRNFAGPIHDRTFFWCR